LHSTVAWLHRIAIAWHGCSVTRHGCSVTRHGRAITSVARVNLGGQAVSSIGITITLSWSHVGWRKHSLDGATGSDDGRAVGTERKLSSGRSRTVVDPDGKVLLAALHQEGAQDVVETLGIADALARTANDETQN